MIRMKRQEMEKKLKELFLYGIGGVLTTLVNYLIYYGVGSLGIGYLMANTVAWMAAVVFSFFVNRSVVFGSKGAWLEEFLPFAGLRLLTLAAENLLLYLLVGQLRLDPMLSKVLVSIVTILGNYMICKKRIFKKSR